MNFINVVRKKKFEDYQKYHNGKITIENFREHDYRRMDEYIVNVFEDFQNLTLNGGGRTIEFEIMDWWKSDKYFSPYVDKTVVVEYVIKANIKTKSPKTGEIKSNNEATLKILVPKLMNKKLFYLYDNIYIPVLYMFDNFVRIYKKGIRIDLPLYGINLDFESNKVTLRNTKYNRPLNLTVFLYFIFDAHKSEKNYRIFKKIMFKNYAKYINNSKKVSQLIRNFDKNLNKWVENEIEYFRYYYMMNYLWMVDEDLKIFDVKMDFGKMLKKIIDTYLLGFRINKESLYSELPKDIVDGGIKKILFYLIKNYIITDEDINQDFINNVNLKNRRILFLENMVRPLYWNLLRYINAVSRDTKYGFEIADIIYDGSIVNEFVSSQIKRYKGKYLWDFPTPYCGVRAAQILNYDGDEDKINLDTRLLHDSQYNIICPIATSSSHPGIVLHTVPETPLDKYGHFVEKFEKY